jgi:hypothetical protein
MEIDKTNIDSWAGDNHLCAIENIFSIALPASSKTNLRVESREKVSPQQVRNVLGRALKVAQ